MSTDVPLVTAIVLNWNSYDDSAECIHGLQEQSYSNLDIIAVDNGSTDGSAERIEEEFEDIEIARNEHNLGFTGGMNRGIQEALSRDSEFILLANNDIRLPDRDIVADLAMKFRDTPSLGALSPTISTESNSTVTLYSSLPNIRNGRSGQRRFATEISDPDLSYGCHYSFVLFPRKILELVGDFDERYFLYFEDIEHGARIENEGFHLATDDSIFVEHESHGSSSSPIGPLPSYYQARNRLIFMQDYNSAFDYSYLLPLYLWWFLSRLSYRLYRRNTAGAIALVQGVIDAMRGKTGKGLYP